MVSLSRHRKQPTSVIEMAEAEVPSTLSKDKLGQSHHILLSYNEIPQWHQDNDCIFHGCRPESHSAHAYFSSWLYLHNETVNIFSHLIPAVCFLLANSSIYICFQAKYPESTIGDRLVFAFFLLTATACLGMSAVYHTLMNCSDHVSNLCLRLDFVGIIVLTLGDFVSGIYMVFYCEPTLQRIYWTMVYITIFGIHIVAKCYIQIITLGLASIVILVNPRFQGGCWRIFRVCTFVITGLSGFAPLAHGIKTISFGQMKKQSGMTYYVGEGFILLLGAFFYSVGTETM